jgi:flagellar hook protein FlgE
MLLNGGATVGSTDATFTMTAPIFDSFGGEHTLTSTWTKIGQKSGGFGQQPLTPGGDQVWSVIIQDLSSGGVVQAPYDNTGSSTGVIVEFDTNGNPAGFYANGTTSLDTTTIPRPYLTPPELQISWPTGAADSNIAINFGTPALNDGVTNLGQTYQVNSTPQDGFTSGNFQSISFSAEGIGVVSLTNGEEIPYCQIPLAMFNNVNGLEESLPGVFIQSTTSGSYSLTIPGKSGSGTIIAKTYEGSTVDGTTVYLGMLSTQQAFLGNVNAIKIDKDMNDRLMSI